jgi:hypothetical protein
LNAIWKGCEQGTSQNRQKDQTEFDDPIQASTFAQGVPRLGTIAGSPKSKTIR